MNSVNIIGNLTKDPELRYTTGENSKAVCRFTVAVNDGYGDKQRTSFLPVVAFGKTAENCDKFLSKGRKCGVTGRLQTGSYEKDGRTIYTTDIIADRVEFIGGQEQSQSQDRPQEQPQEPEQQMGFAALDDSDVPF